MNKDKWTKEQLENFFRQETMWMDDTCKEIALKLSTDGILNLLIKQNPSDYTKRKH